MYRAMGLQDTTDGFDSKNLFFTHPRRFAAGEQADYCPHQQRLAMRRIVRPAGALL
jgi:hypothetical protein